MNAFYEHHKDNIRSLIGASIVSCCMPRFSRFNRNSGPSAFSGPIARFIQSVGRCCVTSLRSTTTGPRTAPKNGVYQFRKIPQAGAMTSWSATSDVPNPVPRQNVVHLQNE